LAGANIDSLWMNHRKWKA